MLISLDPGRFAWSIERRERSRVGEPPAVLIVIAIRRFSGPLFPALIMLFDVKPLSARTPIYPGAMGLVLEMRECA